MSAVPREPANDNTTPIIVLRPIGDGRALARTLARVLVRQELIFANAIPKGADCENLPAVG